MRNLLSLIGLAVVVFGGVGWYLGWYQLSVSKGSDGTVQVQTRVDTNKVLDDSGKGLNKVGEFLSHQAGSAGTPAPTAVGTTPPPAPPPAPRAAPLKDGAGWLLGHVLGEPTDKR